jgi:hypothetical protein
LVGDEQPKPRTKGKMPQYKVCLAFAELADVALDDFAVAIITGLTDNTSYPTPPVTVAQLATLKSTFEDATVAAATRCGRAATAAKNAARDALVLALRKNAAYVEVTCNNDLPTLLSSWFEAASHSAT